MQNAKCIAVAEQSQESRLERLDLTGPANMFNVSCANKIVESLGLSNFFKTQIVHTSVMYRFGWSKYSGRFELPVEFKSITNKTITLIDPKETYGSQCFKVAVDQHGQTRASDPETKCSGS